MFAGFVVAVVAVLLAVVAVSFAGSPRDRPPPPAGQLPVVAGWWRTQLDAVPLGTAESDNDVAAALARQWSHFGQGEAAAYGLPEVASARRDGLPAPPGGDDHAITLDHEPGDPASHRKLYKSFSAASWPAGTEPFSQRDGSPTDVSARYIVYEYIDAARLRLTERGWVNLAQLKEGYATADGRQTSDPSWWLVVYDRDGQLYLDLAHYNEGRIAGRRLDFRPYLNRWLKIELRVYQHDRLEVYLDDQLFDVGRQTEYPVGRMRYAGRPIAPGGPAVTREEGWIFGAGNYSNPSDPSSGSLVHVGPAAVLPLPQP
nr:hypothetical protein [uncultured Actinoplanes sp.]